MKGADSNNTRQRLHTLPMQSCDNAMCGKQLRHKRI